MFKIPITLFSLLICSALFAQRQPSIELSPEKLFKDSPLKKKPIEFPSFYRPNGTDLFQRQAGIPEIPVDTAGFNHSNSFGSVYSLPGCNMPLLKPEPSSSFMPGAVSNDSLFLPKSGSIPNGLQLRGLFFGKPSIP